MADPTHPPPRRTRFGVRARTHGARGLGRGRFERRTASIVVACLFACNRGPVTGDERPSTTSESNGFEGSGEVGAPSTETEATTTEETETETETETESTEEGTPCFESEYSFVPPHPNVVLMLDNSASMIATYDHDGDASTPTVSRWAALHAAVSNILAAYDERIDFGAKVFPIGIGCSLNEQVDVPCEPLNAAPILNQIPEAMATNSSGLTPSGTAFVQTLSYLETLPAELPRAIIFMADGSTSVGCEEPNTGEEIVPILEAAFNQGNAPSIRTFVVGINADTELTVEQLESFGRAGGAPPGEPAFFDAQDQAGLEAAMDEILSEVVSCKVPLESEPPIPELVRVRIEDQDFAWLDPTSTGFDCMTQAGFRYTGPLELELCGQACERFQAMQVPAAQIEYFCG